MAEVEKNSSSVEDLMGGQIAVRPGAGVNDEDPSGGLSLSLDPIVQEAKKRFSRCEEWEATSRMRWLEDYKFEHGDSDNGFQWPNGLRRDRDTERRPCLTMNLIHQHNLQISNEARKSKASVKYLPLGGGATLEAALTLGNIVRRVENLSGAQDAFTLARGFQIGPGIGWWRIVTGYTSPTSFDQEVFVVPVNDPLSIYMDPDIKLKTGADANFAFVFDDIPLEQWDDLFPEHKGIGKNPIGITGDDWLTKDHIRVCEYFRKEAQEDTLVSFFHQGTRKTILKSRLTPNMMGILDDPLTKTRPTRTTVVKWYLIAGDQVIDSTVWPGKYIPLVRCVGEEIVVEGIMDRKGHTRAMKDAQRMLNYNASSQVEFVALQGKTPWVAPAVAIEEYESMWNTANVTNHSVLVYNAFDDQGNAIPPPQRQQPPSASPAYQSGMDTAFNQMMMVSGQWQNQMGMMGNERTGAAIGKRMEQGETATFHFQDNYESSLRFTGEIYIDLFPQIYDTERVFMIQAENDQTIEVKIDPAAQQAFQLAQAQAMEGAQLVVNLNIGEYGVAPAVGPAYGSKREQTAEALTLILTQAPDLVPVVGDLLLGSMDFEKAQEAAQRLRRLVPPQALGQGPSPMETALNGQVASLRTALTESLQRQGKDELKLVGKEQMRDIDTYKAQTDRLGVLKELLPMDAGGLQELVRGLVEEAMTTSLKPIIDANANNLDIDEEGNTEAPVSGARQAPDGQWYLPDPSRPGKHLLVRSRGAA